MNVLSAPRTRKYRKIELSNIKRVQRYQIENHVHAFYMDNEGNITYYTSVR